MRWSLRRISPPPIRPGGSIRPMIAVPVSDLPAPDSPTTPSTSPGMMSKETPSTATKVPRRVGNSTRKLRTLRRAWSSQLRIERLAHPIAEQIDGEHQSGKRYAGKDRDPPFAGEQEFVADADQGAERRLGRRQPD